MLILQGGNWKWSFARILCLLAPYIFLFSVIKFSLQYRLGNHTLGSKGSILCLIGITVALLSLYLLNILFNGKIRGLQPWLFGFEDYMDLHTIKKLIFIEGKGRFSWSTVGSSLSRLCPNGYGKCEGLDTTTDPDTATGVCRAVHSRIGEEKIFTLVDTSVDNQVSLAILLGVGSESHNAVHALHKRKFFQAWPCPVTSHSVSFLLKKSIKPTIDLTLQIPHDWFNRELYLMTIRTMTVTIFAALRPPVVVVVYGQEGGMERALLCLYE